MKRVAISGIGILISLIVYTSVMARLDLVTPPQMAHASAQADLLKVDKSERVLKLLRDGTTIAQYSISLGANGDAGHKQAEGDERTPEGRYVIDWRNQGSFAHLSLHVSYPNQEDTARAQALGVSPGGMIMIHGLPNGWGWLGRLHLAWDWTDGCLAVTNKEMRQIWSRVPNGTPIEIAA